MRGREMTERFEKSYVWKRVEPVMMWLQFRGPF